MTFNLQFDPAGIFGYRRIRKPEDSGHRLETSIGGIAGGRPSSGVEPHYRAEADPLGRHDVIFTLADQYALAASIPNATLNLYSETGHGLHVEWPQRFVDDLETFAR